MKMFGIKNLIIIENKWDRTYKEDCPIIYWIM